jgi:ABC-type transport system involved in multi-copper enzyme maturation permease subunit
VIGAIAILGLLGAGIAADWGFIRGLAKGKTIILILSQILMTFCAFLGVSMTADSLVEERRDGTLGLLFLTPLSRLDLLLGRLVSSSLTSVYGVIGLLPVAGLTMLYGGVTFGEFGRLALVLANTLFVSLAVGLFVSSVAADSRKAYTSGIALLALIFLGPYLLVVLSHAMETGYGPEDLRLLMAVSPIYSLVNSGCLIPWWGYDSELFSISMVFGHALAWGLVLGGAQLLKLSFLRSSAAREKRSWNFLRRLNQSRLTESSRQHKALHYKPITGEPYAWLMGRGIEKKSRVELFLVALLIIGTIAYVQYPSYIEFPAFLLFFAAMFLSVWLLIEVVTRVVEERKTGSFELLLTSPLGVNGMLRGIDRGLWFQFGRGVIGLLVVAVICVASLNDSQSREFISGFSVLFGSFVGMFLLGLWASKWAGLWSAVRSRGTIRALVVPVLVIFVLPWLLTFLSGASIVFYRETFRLEQQGLEWHELRMVWLLAFVPLVLAYGLRSRDQFIRRTWSLASYGFDYRSAEADWTSDSATRTGQNGERLKRVPIPRTLRGRIAVGLGCLGVLLFLVGQGRRVFYERQFDRLIEQIDVVQKPLANGDGRVVVTDFGKVPSFLYEVANKVASPRTMNQVDVAALAPALSRAPKWTLGVSKESRIEMLERVRAVNERGILSLVKGSQGLESVEDLPMSDFRSWQERRILGGIYDLLGCEIYYQLLKNRPANASQALLSGLRLLDYFHSDTSSVNRSMTWVFFYRFQIWFMMVLSQGNLPEGDLGEMERLLVQIERRISVVDSTKRSLAYMKAYTGIGERMMLSGPQKAEAALRMFLYKWENITGSHAQAWAGLASWAPIFLSAVKDLEAGDPSAYEEISRPHRTHVVNPRYTSVAKGLSAGMVQTVDTSISFVARIRLMRLAILLERARRDLGEFPSKLDEIAGGNDQSDLNDPYLGESFQYLLSERGYRIQSAPAWLRPLSGFPVSGQDGENRIELEIPVDDAVFEDFKEPTEPE